MTVQIYIGDCLDVLPTLPANSIHCCITSPPYYGLRDYGADGQIGLEESPQEYVDKMVRVFREVCRVLREDGTLWLNLGDSYATNGGSRDYGSYDGVTGRGPAIDKNRTVPNSLKPKDLIGIPWRVALALQADGWWLRSDIIWHKPNCMPESVRDRPTKAHEYVFLLTKSARYFYDAEAIKENAISTDRDDGTGHYAGNRQYKTQRDKARLTSNDNREAMNRVCHNRNRRTVWTIPTSPYSGAHFATFPTKLIEPMIAAGTSERGCCPECGKPWVRMIERTFDGEYNDKEGAAQRLRCKGAISGGTEKVTLGKTEHVNQKTTGWQQSCTCNAGDPIPFTVLDPFGGAGTTALQADRMGRDAVIIELNESYVRDLAHPRIAGDAPMFADVEIMEANRV